MTDHTQNTESIADARDKLADMSDKITDMLNVLRTINSSIKDDGEFSALMNTHRKDVVQALYKWRGDINLAHEEVREMIDDIDNAEAIVESIDSERVILEKLLYPADNNDE